MKKVYLHEVRQNKMKCYTGVLPARELVRLATTKELNMPQDAQRPIESKRLELISKFVEAGGLISTSIVIGTCDREKLAVYPLDSKEVKGLFYMEFPETEKEFEDYKNTFDIMDGQHRLFSFLPEYLKITENVDFDLAFQMYVTPTLKERQLIFKNTNEEQKSVASNLLLWFRQQLGMLSQKEKIYHPIVDLLNTEACSPLKGRIIMGAEKITGGFKAEQIISILDKTNIKSLINIDIEDSNKVLQLISEYLCGWEEAVGVKISDRDQNYAPFSKISGFRFMMLMLPAFFDKAVNERVKFDKTFIKNNVNTLFANEGMQAKDIFDKNSEYIKKLETNPFTGETPITLLATTWSNKLKSLSSGSFDPLA